MSTNPVEDFLSGGGPPSAKFPTIGVTVKGTVTDAVVSQQTDFATGHPATWDDGGPKMQLVVTLATDESDDTIADDDGTRRVFIKGQMRSAVAEAVKASGSRGIEAGGTLAIKYEADGEASKPGFSPPKLYKAQYKAGVAAVSVDELI